MPAPNAAPGKAKNDDDAITDKRLRARNGYGVLWFYVIAAFLSLAGLIFGGEVTSAFAIVGLVFFGVTFLCVILPGLLTLQPNESLVCLLFGRYAGTEHRSGLWWVNPLYTKKRVSRRLHTLECGPLKVNDAIGNPIDIGAVIVWRVHDAAKATLEVVSYADYVQAQSETALRRMASTHPYDNIEIEDAIRHAEETGTEDAVRVRKTTLRDGGDEISDALLAEIRTRMQPVGIAVTEARISHLAYSSEIAGAMLRRQAAGAVVAARRLVVKGAVSIVENALQELEKAGIGGGLDGARRATLISNLLVVLVSDREVTPVVNAGSRDS